MTKEEYLEKHCRSSCRRDGCPHEEQWEAVSTKPTWQEETNACVQANIDDLENGKIQGWQARNNILAHFKTRESYLLTTEREALHSELDKVREAVIKEVIHKINYARLGTYDSPDEALLGVIQTITHLANDIK